MSDAKDQWSSQAYQSAASFVPQLASKVTSWLSVQPHDRILDIGCGDGILTAQIAASEPTSTILGLDASASMIETAKASNSAKVPNCRFEVGDCSKLSSSLEALSSGGYEHGTTGSGTTGSGPVTGEWDKCFSNAALHWILRAESTRNQVLKDVHAALKQDGLFVFEMGGHGNVAEVRAAFLAALVAHGVSITKAREVDPWFFPSETWARKALETAGFEVEKIEIEYRPTKLNPATEDGKGGIEGWARLMGAQFLEAVSEDKRDSVVRHVLDTLKTIITREEDGSMYIGYVRLRAAARKR